MEGTPKSSKRKINLESPTLLYDNFMDTADVSYDFLPKTKMRGASSSVDCQIPLGQRPKKFSKSPNLHVRTSRRTMKEKKQINQQEIRQRIFNNLLDNADAEEEEASGEVSNFDDRVPVMKEACEDEMLNTMFDDSSNDVMIELSQQVEKDVPQNFTGSVNCDASVQLPDYEQKIYNRNQKNRHLLKKKQYHHNFDNGEKIINSDNLLRNKISKRSSNMVKKTSVQYGRPGNVKNNTSHYSGEDFMKQYNLLRERNKLTPDILDIVSLEFNRSHASLLLEDGNDAGFFEVDETTLNCSNISSMISFSQKCTPQEIETKRKEALKKLQEKMKAKQVKH